MYVVCIRIVLHSTTANVKKEEKKKEEEKRLVRFVNRTYRQDLRVRFPQARYAKGTQTFQRTSRASENIRLMIMTRPWIRLFCIITPQTNVASHFIS